MTLVYLRLGITTEGWTIRSEVVSESLKLGMKYEVLGSARNLYSLTIVVKIFFDRVALVGPGLNFFGPHKSKKP